MEEDDSSLFYGKSQQTTPMMAQYFEIKKNYKDCLLLFRMGDFFELFFDDAKTAASVLNIALTHRGKHLKEDVPMCGIPVVALDNYLARLVRTGYKLAICDQTEDPEEAKKRGPKSVVRREVIRIITPGTILEDDLLNGRANNFLMAVVPDISRKSNVIKTISFAVIDISTGDFFVNTVFKEDFPGILSIYDPKEFLLPSFFQLSEFERYLSNLSSSQITYLPDTKFNPAIERQRLEKYFQVNTLESFGIQLDKELSACGALLEYLLITQKSQMPTLPIPKKITFSDYLIIDAATSKSLELVTSDSGEYTQSLLGTLDRTVTPFGARALATRLASPLTSIEKIRKRLDCVEYFEKNKKICDSIRDILSQSPDFERSLNRIKFGKFSPKNIGDVRELLRILESLKSVTKGNCVPSEGEYSFSEIGEFSELLSILEKAVVDYASLPASNRHDSYIIVTGYSKKLDELRYYKDHSQALITQLQSRYVSDTGITTLKIKNNAILGWYVEIPISQISHMPPVFIHRQTLVGNVRYVTNELTQLQDKMFSTAEEANSIELEIFNKIVKRILDRYDEMLYAIKTLACLDIYTSFAKIAIERNYIRPNLTNEPVLEIKEGKHPIISLKRSDFTANDCDLDSDHRIALLTGPNMAGKSTYLRQNALLIIMAQVGCYVPATTAKIGIIDRLFSRIGASDDIVRGRSTFMVEMIETATILNQATERSFVILDEVGRGTSTYDGLSIAWAVIENLYKVNKCRVLFATHYRELTVLQNTLKNMLCKTLKVQEWNGEVIFYHKIIDGVADKSYGIHVASIAGLPKSVVHRAKQLLKKFEEGSAKSSAKLNNIPVTAMDSLFDHLEDSVSK